MDFELKQNDFIELNRLLKVVGLVDSGGMANYLIVHGNVIVNGLIESRKRKKIVRGDIVEVQGKLINIK